MLSCGKMYYKWFEVGKCDVFWMESGSIWVT